MGPRPLGHFLVSYLKGLPHAPFRLDQVGPLWTRAPMPKTRIDEDANNLVTIVLQHAGDLSALGGIDGSSLDFLSNTGDVLKVLLGALSLAFYRPGTEARWCTVYF